MKKCERCNEEPVRLKGEKLCFDCYTDHLREKLTDRFIASDPRYTLLEPIRICPVCGVSILRGRRETCSDRCRKKLSRMGGYKRENGKPANGVTKRDKTTLQLSADDAESIGAHIRHSHILKTNTIEKSRWDVIKSGEAQTLGLLELRELSIGGIDVWKVLGVK